MLSLVNWKPSQRSHILWVPHMEFFASLPESLRSLSLDLSLIGPVSLVDAFSDYGILASLEAFDNILGGSKFSHLTCVELIWSTRWGSEFVDDLCDLLRKGGFARTMPKLHNRGILWCGDRIYFSKHRVYPISGPSHVLATHDRMAWMDLSRPPLFPSSSYCLYPSANPTYSRQPIPSSLSFHPIMSPPNPRLS